MTGIYKKLTGGMPILPRSETDPVGQTSRVDSAVSEFNGKLDRIRRYAIGLLESIPSGRITANREYNFEIDQFRAEQIYRDLDAYIDAELMATIDGGLWFQVKYMEPAYRAGSMAAYLNLAMQIAEYKQRYPTSLAYQMSERYRRRVALVRARQFEVMKGINGDTKTNLARILGDGIEAGSNPRIVAQQIATEIGHLKKRAKAIAQTEITTALRRARWDENDEAEQEFGVRLMELWLSALKPTTRISHAERHGKLYTREQVRAFYAEGANAINCYCNQTSVAVDADGNIVSEAMKRRMPRLAEKREEMLSELEEIKHG